MQTKGVSWCDMQTWLVRIYADRITLVRICKPLLCWYKYMQSIKDARTNICKAQDALKRSMRAHNLTHFVANFFLQTFLGNVLQNLPLCVIAKGVTKQELQSLGSLPACLGQEGMLMI